MMSEKRILITGASGYIGKILHQELSARGYEVWGLSRKTDAKTRTIQCDLLCRDSVLHALSIIPDFSVVIHAAALAHSEKKGRQDSYMNINKTMMENVICSVERMLPQFIFLSSVAVYGEAGRNTPICINSELRPSNEYGTSKVMCEEILQQSKIKNYHILRLGPVYDESNLKDIKKRVYFPFQSKLKIKVLPSPQYSVCHVSTLSKIVIGIVERKAHAQVVTNVICPNPYDQSMLLNQFEGIEIPCPVIIFTPLYYISYLIPKRYGYKFRCLYWKIFKDNIYR